MAEELKGNAGQTVGFTCTQLVQNNLVSETDLVFYFDLSYPEGANYGETQQNEKDALDFVQEELLMNLAETYEISSGLRCSQPPIGDGSWLVKISSKPSQYSRVQLFGKFALTNASLFVALCCGWSLSNGSTSFPALPTLLILIDTCRELVPEPGDACRMYEGIVSASTLGDESQSLPDVAEYIEMVLNSEDFTNNTAYATKYLGKPEVDVTVATGKGDSLSGVDSIQEQIIAPVKEGRRTVTIVGGLLVAAFCLAFVGLFMILYRRRKKYLRDRDIQLAISKSDDHHFHHRQTSSDEGPGKTLEPQTTSEDLAENLEDDDSRDNPIEYPNNITFDLGHSFKDQLMGVHGRSAAHKSHLMNPFGRQSSIDAASESDADSWAQTDGTIGSLELQLEPITAEV